ncbi:MAG: glycosyltransferase family 2 protein, partial [Bacteroidales bacterium]|nr:glycosyltransferase family 2 protein [Bacteroidales bacterium]
MEVKRFDLPLRASTRSVRQVAAAADTEYTLIYTRQSELSWVRFGQERLVQIASDSGAAMIYADHFDGERPAPVIDYQQGSLRDDFDFGGVQLYRTSALKEAAARMDAEYEFAGLYDLRLRVSEIGPLVHVNEFLYYELESDR